MRKFIDFILSIMFGGILLLFIAFSTALATFIENDFGSVAAKAAVYNARWFEIVILITFLNIAWSAFKYNPFKTKRYSVFIFHLAFLLIILGAAVTRYIGFEGVLAIREGQSSNLLMTDETYVRLSISEEGKEYSSEESVLFSPITKAKGKVHLNITNEKYTLICTEYLVNAQEVIAEAAEGPQMLNLSATVDGKFNRFSLFEGESETIGLNRVSFQAKERQANTIEISSTSEGLFIRLPQDGARLNMMSTENIPLKMDSLYPFDERVVYQIGSENLVLKTHYKHAQMSVQPSQMEENTGVNAARFILKNSQGKRIETYAIGGKGYVAPANRIQFDGKTFEVSYGSKNIELPFSLKLNDFQLERYPASHSPSSYASEVTLIDNRIGLKKDFRIFMNNVLDYEGFRFFQSSYDTDEKGTILSVNHDFWGMLITYIGYGLMILGMFLAIFERSTHFQKIIRTKNVCSFTLAFLLISGLSILPSSSISAQTAIQQLENIPQQHLDKFSKIIVQGHNARFKPLNSMSGETFRKFSRQNGYKGLNTDQILLGMMIDPDFWMHQELIKVSNAELKKVIGNANSRVAFADFFYQNQQNAYKLDKFVDEAYRKNPALRSTFDKDVISVDERVNVFYMAATGRFLTIFPVPNLPQEPWKSMTDKLDIFPSEEAAFVKSIVENYLAAVKRGIASNNWGEADSYLEAIHAFQQKYAAEEIKDTAHFNLEILYNRIDIFKQLSFVNGLLGFVLLVLLFIRILWPKNRFKWLIVFLVSALFLGFIVHTAGLALRWYIAGHAPWSDGYESMIFIGWASMLAGLSFYKKAPIALGATAVLTFLILYVAHLSWMNPEITNLVPVLKSYWLTIHVAVITASYGFLALGSFLGILNLVLMLLQSHENQARIQIKIKELSRINEASLIAGLYLLTIGTFLGGIWANESWGRYWGWDPKETWAFVTVLVYAFIVHLRMIPGMKSFFAFNVASIFAYFSVLMTYFGVNYYLSGLHSYASGDPMPIPDFVYYAVALLMGLSIFAYFANKKYPVK